MDILRFQVGEIEAAIPATHVREVLRAVEISALPGAPPVVDGVIDVRGEIVPVVNLRARLGLPVRPLDPAEQFVLIATAGGGIAARVDRATALSSIPDDAVGQAAGLLATGWNVAGVVRTADGVLVIHDPDAFLTQTEQLALDGALRHARV